MINNILSSWLLANLMLVAMVGLGFFEYMLVGRKEKKREEKYYNQWVLQAQGKEKKKRVLMMLKNVRSLVKEYRLTDTYASQFTLLEKEVNQAGAVQNSSQTYWEDQAKNLLALERSMKNEYHIAAVQRNKLGSLFFALNGTVLMTLRISQDIFPLSLTKVVFSLFFILLLFFSLYIFCRLFFAKLYLRVFLKLASFYMYISPFSRFFTIYAITRMFIFASVGLAALYFYYVYIPAYTLLFPSSAVLIEKFPSAFIFVGDFLAVVLAYVEVYKFLKGAFVKKHKQTK